MYSKKDIQDDLKFGVLSVGNKLIFEKDSLMISEQSDFTKMLGSFEECDESEITYVTTSRRLFRDLKINYPSRNMILATKQYSTEDNYVDVMYKNVLWAGLGHGLSMLVFNPEIEVVSVC